MLLVLAALTMSLQDSVSYANPDAWLCRPGREDACTIDLSTVVLSETGTQRIEAFEAAKNPAIDCFYVYPTVSRESGDHSDIVADKAERDVIRQQFARFRSVCRPFAPMYRQVTLPGLQRMMTAPKAGVSMNRGRNYDDVAAAWRHYLEHDNNGRGVVLIGHSQGAMILQELISKEIDGKPMQARIVSALLLGTSVPVPKGKDVGGQFASMPLCRQPSQTGCIISYATFRATHPPSRASFFARAAKPEMEAACTNPADLSGKAAPLRSYFTSLPANPTTRPHVWAGEMDSLRAPFVSLPGLLSAACVSDANGSRLEITVHADSADPRADDIPGDVGAGTAQQQIWGLHSVDVNLTLGNLIDVVRTQAVAFTRKGK